MRLPMILIYIKIITIGKMKNAISNHRLLTLFLISILIFSLTCSSIFKGGVVIGTDAYAKRSEKSQSDADSNRSIDSTDTQRTPESSQPGIKADQGSAFGSSPTSSDVPSTRTTAPTDNQKGEQIVPGGGTIPLDQGNRNNTNTNLQLANPPESVTGSNILTATPENNSGFVPRTSISNQTIANEPIINNTSLITNRTGYTTNGTNPSPTNGTSSQGAGGNTTNTSIAIAIAVQNIVNHISSGGTNNAQLQALIQQLIALLVKQGQASNPNIKFVELQSVPIDEYFANSTRLGSTVKIVNHTLLVDPLTREIFAKGVVKNTGTSNITSVSIYADEYNIANRFIQRTQSAPNIIPLKPGDSFTYAIDLRGHFTGIFDGREIAAVRYQLLSR